jgi:hypothetical protein
LICLTLEWDYENHELKSKKMKYQRWDNNELRDHELLKNANQNEVDTIRIINIDKIIEREIDRMTRDKKLNKDFSGDLSLLRKHWKALCTTYSRLANARNSYLRRLASNETNENSSSRRRLRK